MGRTMQKLGFKFYRRSDGLITVKFEDSTYTGTQNGVGEWVWNVAHNHEQGRIVDHAICKWCGRPFFDYYAEEDAI